MFESHQTYILYWSGVLMTNCDCRCICICVCICACICICFCVCICICIQIGFCVCISICNCGRTELASLTLRLHIPLSCSHKLPKCQCARCNIAWKRLVKVGCAYFCFFLKCIYDALYHSSCLSFTRNIRRTYFSNPIFSNSWPHLSIRDQFVEVVSALVDFVTHFVEMVTHFVMYLPISIVRVYFKITKGRLIHNIGR